MRSVLARWVFHDRSSSASPTGSGPWLAGVPSTVGHAAGMPGILASVGSRLLADAPPCGRFAAGRTPGVSVAVTGTARATVGYALLLPRLPTPPLPSGSLRRASWPYRCAHAVAVGGVAVRRSLRPSPASWPMNRLVAVSRRDTHRPFCRCDRHGAGLGAMFSLALSAGARWHSAPFAGRCSPRPPKPPPVLAILGRAVVCRSPRVSGTGATHGATVAAGNCRLPPSAGASAPPPPHATWCGRALPPVRTPSAR